MDLIMGRFADQHIDRLSERELDDYERLDCPIFLQYGADDTSVPVGASVARLTPALRHPRSAIRVYPGLEHSLNVLPRDVTGLSPEEAGYLFHRFRYGAGVRAELVAWLRENA